MLLSAPWVSPHTQGAFKAAFTRGERLGWGYKECSLMDEVWTSQIIKVG